MPGRCSPGTPLASHGMRRGHSSPLVRRRIADGCGSLWHSSVSSSTRSPMTTSRRPPLSPPVSLGALRQGLQSEERAGNGEKKFQVRLKSQKYMQCCQIESLNKERYEVCRFFKRKSHSVYDFASRHISLSVLLSNSICLSHASHSSLLSPFHLFCQSMRPPPRRLTGGDR